MARAFKLDVALAGEVDFARGVIVESVPAGQVGEHLGATADGERLVTHRFAARLHGYAGWNWYVTLARVPRAKAPTVSEVGLLPGDGALLAPEWVPWADRVKPEELAQEQAAAAAEAADAAGTGNAGTPGGEPDGGGPDGADRATAEQAVGNPAGSDQAGADPVAPDTAPAEAVGTIDTADTPDEVDEVVDDDAELVEAEAEAEAAEKDEGTRG